MSKPKRPPNAPTPTRSNPENPALPELWLAGEEVPLLAAMMVTVSCTERVAPAESFTSRVVRWAPSDRKTKVADGDRLVPSPPSSHQYVYGSVPPATADVKTTGAAITAVLAFTNTWATRAGLTRTDNACLDCAPAESLAQTCGSKFPAVAYEWELLAWVDPCPSPNSHSDGTRS